MELLRLGILSLIVIVPVGAVMATILVWTPDDVQAYGVGIVLASVLVIYLAILGRVG